nr:MAG TPA: hypothetical protein [Caudoviricetes sp.]
MTEEFQGYLSRVQSLQRRYVCDMNSFSVSVKYDSYFEEYLEVEIRTDNDKFFFTTYNCLYDEDYERVLKELEKTVEQIISDNEEQESDFH